MPRRLISSGSAFEEQIGYSRAVVVGDTVYVSRHHRLRLRDRRDLGRRGGAGRADAAQHRRRPREGRSRASTSVVRVHYLLADGADFEKCWPALRAAFGAGAAGRDDAAGTAAWSPRCCIEIEVTAVIGSALLPGE